MRAEHIDALLVISIPNIRYLTGFSGSTALVLVTQKEIHFITDFRYETQVADEVGDLARVTIEPSTLWAGLWGLLPSAAGIEIIGFESAHIIHRDFQRLLSDGTKWQWRPQLGLVEGLRESKDADEVALIREAAGLATRALGVTV
jgi:Xaa-Pro aminopeptidase